MAAKNVL